MHLKIISAAIEAPTGAAPQSTDIVTETIASSQLSEENIKLLTKSISQTIVNTLLEKNQACDQLVLKTMIDEQIKTIPGLGQETSETNALLDKLRANILTEITTLAQNLPRETDANSVQGNIQALANDVINLRSSEEVNLNEDIEAVLKKHFKKDFNSPELKDYIQTVRLEVRAEVIRLKRSINLIFPKEEIEAEVTKILAGLEVDINQDFFIKSLLSTLFASPLLIELPQMIKDIIQSIQDMSHIMVLAKNAALLYILFLLIVNAIDKMVEAIEFNNRIRDELPPLMKRFTREENFESLLQALDKIYDGPTRYKFKTKMLASLKEANWRYNNTVTKQLAKITVLKDKLAKGKISFTTFKNIISERYIYFGPILNEKIKVSVSKSETNKVTYLKLSTITELDDTKKTKIIEKLTQRLTELSDDNDANKAHIKKLLKIMNRNIGPDHKLYSPWKLLLSNANNFLGKKVLKK